MLNKIKGFKAEHANLYEFIMFNLLSNLATITNFVVINISNSFLFQSLANRDFKFWVFDYTVANGGLGGFLAFMLSYACAQSVNFVVQRKLVFQANNKLVKGIPIYVIMILIVYLICIYVPTLIMAPLTERFGSFWAINLTNVVNILIQMVINYPVLKLFIMKKVDEAK